MRKDSASPSRVARSFSPTSTPGSAPECPENSRIFLFRRKPDPRLLSVVASSMEESGGSARATGGMVDGMAARTASGVWPKAVQELPSACDRATRSCAVREHRADPTGAMQNSTAGTTGVPTPPRGSRIRLAGPGRCRILPDRTRPACGILQRGLGSGWIARGRRRISHQARPEHRRLRADQGSGWSDQGDAESFRTEHDRATGRDPARAQLTPDLRGCALSSVGQAKPGQGSAGRSSGAMHNPPPATATAA
ncbi:hypothetical protein ActroDRAFT_0122 [Actinospica robiniae DSM 44927]|uniref:Uncharacterized protein n=1 Tax=Actinospica robiniae DSM 44927 TaxID=479430 RepID=W9DZS9_9ACTN|nr:hypothetical protein ActroDRAFT_0122 [Actinospica robiniae DSM 44927]